MPIEPFKLVEDARNKRRDFKLFICSAFIGIISGVLVTLISSISSLSGSFFIFLVINLILLWLLIALYSIQVVIQPKDFHKIMTIYVAYSKDRGRITMLTERFLGFIANASMMVRDGCIKDPEPSIILKGEDYKAIQALILDLIMYNFFDWMSQKYGPWWAPKIRYRGIQYSRFSFKNKNEVDSTIIKYSDLPEDLRNDNLFYRLYGESLMMNRHLEISIPKNTKFQWKKENTRFPKSIVTFCNKYCNSRLSFSISMGPGSGLHTLWGKFVVAKDRDGNESITYLSKHYSHIVFEFDFHTSFNWFWSLMDSSDDYFNWIEDMYDGLDEFFNFEREYEALEKLGKKLELE